MVASSCRPEEKTTENSPIPEIECFVNAEAAEGVVNDILADSNVSFSATVTNTDDFNCAWYIDGEKVANITSFTMNFPDPGEYSVVFSAWNSTGKAQKELTLNVEGCPLEVTWSVEPGELSAKIGEPVEVSVTVVGGDKETVHTWKVDGETVSDSKSFSKTFETPGEYSLTYSGVNRDGMTASGAWTLKILDADLEVSYSPDKSELSVQSGAELNFKANVTSGVFGLVYKWTVNGEELSETGAELKYKFETPGDFKVTQTVTNAAGASDSRTWDVTVLEPEPEPEPEPGVYLYDNFENYPIGVSGYYIGNTVDKFNDVMQVVDNPYPTSVNSSSKVLLDKGSLMTKSSSGYFKFKITTLPDGTPFTSADRAKYTKVRVKIYLGDSGFTPLLQEDNKSTKSAPCSINGSDFDPKSPSLVLWNSLVRTNDWNVFVYDFTGPKYSDKVNNLAGAEQLQFRVFVDFNNNGKKGKDIYFDDIEFIE